MNRVGWNKPGLGVVVSLLVFFVSLNAQAKTPYMQKDNFGLGLVLGSPIAVSAKVMLDDTYGIDGAVGLGFMGGGALHVHADFVFHQKLSKTPYFDLLLTLGVGPRIGVWFGGKAQKYWSKKATHDDSSFGLGVRAKVGVNFLLERVPVELFLEAAPGLGVLPYIGGFIDGGIGVRYYFDAIF